VEAKDVLVKARVVVGGRGNTTPVPRPINSVSDGGSMLGSPQ